MRFVDEVNKTYAYGKIFQYQRSLPELYFWKIGSKSVSYKSFLKKLGSKKHLYKPKKINNPYSSQKITFAKQNLSQIAKLPIVRLLGITGSVSANNAKKNDDIDIFIITAPHTLWITRPLFLLYLEIKGIRRRRGTPLHDQKDLICPNLWLDSTNLKINKQDQNLYTAHEVLQVKPLIDKSQTYQRFLKTNSWVKRFLGNAYSLSIIKTSTQQKYSIVWALLSPINFVFYILQRILMFLPTKGEKIAYTQAFFHDQNFAKKILTKAQSQDINYNKD